MNMFEIVLKDRDLNTTIQREVLPITLNIIMTHKTNASATYESDGDILPVPSAPSGIEDDIYSCSKNYNINLVYRNSEPVLKYIDQVF